MDAITIQRIQLLHPRIRKETLEAYKYINNQLFGNNTRLRFSHTYRSPEQQDELYSYGRTRIYDKNGQRLSKVTNAKAGQSIHNYGLAFDIVILIDKNGDGNFETASWDINMDHDKDGSADWLEAVAHFKKLGYTWGGNWKNFPDYPHFEKTFGHSWQTLEKKYLSNDTFTEIIDGKTYKWANL